MKPTFFPTPSDFRAWLEKNHDKSQELWVGYFKVGSGKPSITWPESVDEALCFGWIDGLRKSVDGDSYMIRFTPRKPRSTWSVVNVAQIQALTNLGRMRPEGLKVFEQRAEEASYSYEQRDNAKLDDADEQRFRANQQAWDFFQAQPASYRKAAVWWVISAKREETKRKRLEQLIADSENGRTVPPLTRYPRPK